jgi:hypothetical protein
MPPLKSLHWLAIAPLLLAQGPVYLGFEEADAPERISDQYTGVTFNDPWLVDYARAGAPGFPHSGSHALTLCYERRPCSDTTFQLSFARPQQRVKVWTGVPGLSELTIFVLTAFDSAGTFIGNFGAGVSAGRLTRIELPLEVKTDSNQISRVTVEIQGAFIPGFAIDDVEFERMGDTAAVVPITPVPADSTNQPTTTSWIARWWWAVLSVMVAIAVAWRATARRSAARSALAPGSRSDSESDRRSGRP